MPTVGEIRWREWGHAPEPEHLSWWVDATAREAGHGELPVTFVSTDSRGEAVGAVGLGAFDIEERRDRSPWLLGMVVTVERRGLGVGRLLLAQLESWAAQRGIAEIWVGTERAAEFYRRCGWAPTETLVRRSGETMTVLNKRL